MSLLGPGSSRSTRDTSAVSPSGAGEGPRGSLSWREIQTSRVSINIGTGFMLVQIEGEAGE